MEGKERVVVRFRDGKLVKGFVDEFSPDNTRMVVTEADSEKVHEISIDDLKAVFFVKTFEGDNEYRERKSYGIRKGTGPKVFIKFTDDESLVGFLEGDVPWERGFHLSKSDKALKGFFLLPVDAGANNIKVFVVASSIRDVTVVPL